MQSTIPQDSHTSLSLLCSRLYPKIATLVSAFCAGDYTSRYPHYSQPSVQFTIPRDIHAILSLLCSRLYRVISKLFPAFCAVDYTARYPRYCQPSVQSTIPQDSHTSLSLLCSQSLKALTAFLDDVSGCVSACMHTFTVAVSPLTVSIIL